MAGQRAHGFSRLLVPVLVVAAGLPATDAVAAPSTAAQLSQGQVVSQDHCSAGAHTLGQPGAVVYPDTGNGGYASVHSDVVIRYDQPTNTFLPGTHVLLSDHATQCLTSFSLDFERSEPGLPSAPDFQVHRVHVNGVPAKYAFAQPTYPGDPQGQDDPDPRAHQVSQSNPVGGPDDNPLPPACSPELTSAAVRVRHSQDGQPCPTTKLVITPRQPIPDGSSFTVRVDYTGRPGLHHDADGSNEGWFVVPGGSATITEPVASEDWMPLNNFPTAKPTYNFLITTNEGKTAVCNGRLVGVRQHPATEQFPDGSQTWHWNAAMPIPSYLVLTMVGDYKIESRVADDGVQYYEVYDTNIPPDQLKHNLAKMDKQADITDFEAEFNGPYPFSSDGIVSSTAAHGAAIEEMESMIVFAYSYVNLDTIYHENMHQWWGDNVTESGYGMTFFKEGMATLGQVLDFARRASAEAKAAGLNPTNAFNRWMVRYFNRVYALTGTFWKEVPSDPQPFDLFSGSATYARPGAAYVALWQILGRSRFVAALHAIQRLYGGSSITEAQLEWQFGRFLPQRTPACEQRLQDFFTQWFDTSYKPGADPSRPQITGPHLDGNGFYGGDCPRS